MIRHSLWNHHIVYSIQCHGNDTKWGQALTWLTFSYRSTTSWPISAAVVVPRGSSRRKKTELSCKKKELRSRKYQSLECGEIIKMDYLRQDCWSLLLAPLQIEKETDYFILYLRLLMHILVLSEKRAIKRINFLVEIIKKHSFERFTSKSDNCRSSNLTCFLKNLPVWNLGELKKSKFWAWNKNKFVSGV